MNLSLIGTLLGSVIGFGAAALPHVVHVIAKKQTPPTSGDK